ncbi:hypothetical protein DPMN_005001 [Dreissena polymorpha]|uniref:Uncharacterized protein n=1 Tax=Dreissena polymorpha TaxID=45954 RepID=A0A9D4MNV0_DREPO|nr:hypothetical protein DPMN_005001 [Dreissena polymorpha]
MTVIVAVRDEVIAGADALPLTMYANPLGFMTLSSGHLLRKPLNHFTVNDYQKAAEARKLWQHIQAAKKV